MKDLQLVHELQCIIMSFTLSLTEATQCISLQVEVQEGDLVCPETGRKFPISKGIPNMLLNEDEV